MRPQTVRTEPSVSEIIGMSIEEYIQRGKYVVGNHNVPWQDVDISAVDWDEVWQMVADIECEGGACALRYDNDNNEKVND